MNTVSRLVSTFTPNSYSLNLDLQRTDRVFHGTVTIVGKTHQHNALRLHAKDLDIRSAEIDGVTAVFIARENDELELSQEGLQPGAHTVTVSFSGKITDAMHGLYPCYFEHNGVKKELLATQFESHHAREVFPCVDEPEAKATFDLSLKTETGVEVLGNMPIKTQEEKDDQLVTTFETSPKMSSYLLAWVVGELHKKTATTKSGVEVNIWATPAQDTTTLDFALDIATRSIDFYDEYFGTQYPLPKADHVALPDFSSGAMENWGLITYRESTLLVDPKNTSVSVKHYVATVIAHELAHQWFGNLVTMKWWNDLWLNESFATLMEYIAVDALEPDWNVWLDFSSSESIMALRRDAIDGVQAVQVDVNHPDEISTLFDGAIVYAKGARLLRMLEVYVGKEAFQTGLAAYFKEHAYKNTSATDLWNAIGDASGKDIASFMDAWISQSGYPVVTVDETTVSQEQFFIGDHQKSKKLWPVPLGSTNSELPELLDMATIDAPNLPLATRLNHDDSAHFITHYSPERMEAILHDIDKQSPVSRLQLLDEQVLLARGGRITTADLLPTLLAYHNETTESVWDIMSLTLAEFRKFVEDDQTAETALRRLSGTLASNLYDELGWDVKPNEPETHTKLRATIIATMLYSERQDVIDEALRRYDADDFATIDAELRSLILSTVVKYKESDELVDNLMKQYQATSSVDLKQDIASGLTSTRNPNTALKLLNASKDSNIIKTQDAFRWFVYLIRNRYARDTAWQWLTENWSWVKEMFGGDKSYDDYPRYAATGLVSREQLDAYSTFFTPMKSEPALTRTIELGVSEIKARVELIERDGEAVRATLDKID